MDETNEQQRKINEQKKREEEDRQRNETHKNNTGGSVDNKNKDFRNQGARKDSQHE